MAADRPVVKKSGYAHRLLRGESVVASTGLAVLVVFLAVFAAAVWQSFRTQRVLSKRACAEKLRAVGELLARSSEALLSASELSALRRIIAEAGLNYGLRQCRIVLPDGRILADADPARINLQTLPPAWSGSLGDYSESSEGGVVTLNYPLDVPGRGAARLQISAELAKPIWADAGAETWIGLVAVGALVGLLLVYHAAKSRFRAVGAIRQALLALRNGETAAAALEVSPQFGPEADAWNKLLEEKEQLKRRAALNEAVESVRSKGGSADEFGETLDALPQGLIIVDEQMRARYVNGAASIFLQVKRDEILGSDVSRFITNQAVLEAVRNAATGPSYKRTIVEVEQDSSAVAGVLRFIVRPVRREDSGIAMVIIEDITQQRVAEKARNAFLAQAAHELRTPLTNILLYVETALEAEEDDPAVRARCLNIINEESRRLERIVGDILSVSEIEAGAFTLNKADVKLDALLEQLKADYGAPAAEKQIDLAFDLPPKLPVLQADRDKVSLALHNLLGNALKYTPAGGKVTVSVVVDQQQVTIEISDTGIGMSEADTEKIFEKFYRAHDPRVAEIKGSGLGLALAREVIRLHGGDITVQSELDKGSTFTLTLPLAEEVE